MSKYRVERWSNPYPPNPAMLRMTLEREGFKVSQWGDRAGMCYPNHFHAVDQSHWIVSGTIEFVIDRIGKVILKAGDRDFLPANTYHSARVVSEESVLYLVGERQMEVKKSESVTIETQSKSLEKGAKKVRKSRAKKK